MVAKYSTYFRLFLLLLIGPGAYAQGHLFSDVLLSQNSVYVGQPVEVTVQVYTSTWFTSGVNPGNIKVNGAFTVYFRSVSSSKQLSGKTYAGVEMIYLVFPYDDEDILFPSLDIRVESPDEGGYKGISRTIKTESKKIAVKPVPPGYNKSEWLVASGMTVSESWSGDKTKVKLGDVLERSISRELTGTVSELIPPIQWDSLPGVSLYPSRSEVNNQKSRTAITASRRDAIRYLFEKEGEVNIPDKVLTWWNPVQNKLYKRTLKGFTMEVLPNPELGMLESVRDSLLVQIAGEGEAEGETSGITILGMALKWFIALVTGCLLFALLLIYGIKKLGVVFRNRRELYLQSELYYFRLFKRESKLRNSEKALSKLYRWIDQLKLESPTLQYFVLTYGSPQLETELEVPGQHRYDLRAWSEARKNYLKGKVRNGKPGLDLWINPPGSTDNHTKNL